ncbi:hypothetical protein MMC09_005298 [Bachmanniomyces sp. S44760]|nr:hypothetical protein [Bachmanniomyces sp. S44760]
MSIRSDRTARGSERDYDRDGGRRAPREPPVRQPRIQLNEYFVDGEGILREVMQTEICKYLGAEATSRPGEYKEMLADLKEMSQGYDRMNRTNVQRGHEELGYGEYKKRIEVEDRRHKDVGMSGVERYHSPGIGGYPSEPPYSSGAGYPPGTIYSPSSGYPPPGSGYPPSSGHPPGSSGFSSGPGIPSSLGYTTGPGVPPGYPAVSRDDGGRYGNPGYVYDSPVGEYPPQNGHFYGAPASYGAPGQSRDQMTSHQYGLQPQEPPRTAPMDERYRDYDYAQMQPPTQRGYPPSRSTPYDGPHQQRDPYATRQEPSSRDPYGGNSHRRR